MAATGRHHLEFAPRAARELKKLAKRERVSVIEKLDDLATIPTPSNLDVEPLKGRAPYLRLRVGAFRVLFRRLQPAELKALETRRGVTGPSGFFIERIVNKADVERAIDTLEVGRRSRGS